MSDDNTTRDNDVPEALVEMYYEQGLSTEEIAKKVVRHWINNYDIGWASLYRDQDLLVELYHERGMSLEKIGGKLGCSGSTVREWMEKHDIKRDKPKWASDHPASFYTTQNGYELWGTNVDGTQRNVFVHRLVCVAEHGVDAVDGMDVHHKNEIPWDNRPENLALMTRSEHMKHHHGSDQTSSSPPTGNRQATITAYTND